MNARVKVTILSYRDSEMTTRCVESLSGCNNLEIFFNGSDGEAEQKFSSNGQIISEPENLSFARVVNLALARAEAQEFLLFVTNDVTFLPGAVATMVECMDRNPNLGLLGPLQLVPGSEEIHHGGGSFDRQRWKADIEGDDTIGKSGLIQRDWIDGGAMLIRRTAVERVGPMRSEYGFYWEDVDWGIRFKQCGFAVGVCLEARVTHASSGTTGQFGRWRQYLIGRNRGLAAKFNLSGAEFKRISRYLRQSMLLRLLQYGFAEKSRVYWAGMRDGLAGRWEGMNQPIADDDPIWKSVLRFP